MKLTQPATTRWKISSSVGSGPPTQVHLREQHYFADHLGTSRVVTSATGVILDDSDFYPFGGERAVVSSSGNTYKFTGKERDPESGLDEFGARYYSSGFGRFASPDAFTYANIADPQSFNQYTYVYNNPLRFTDPTGHLATGQVGYASEGVGAPNFRMHPGGGLGACDEGSCTAGTLITSWELTVVNAEGGVEGTGIFFTSAAAAQAYIAELQAQNQSSAAGQGLKGPYIADLKSSQIAPLLDPNHRPSTSDIVGPNGECVDLSKKFSGMGDVSAEHQWYQGEKVSDAKDIKPGTAIATFNDKGRFPNKHGWNSGIYLGRAAKGGIWILDQWPGHSPSPREVLLDNRRQPADNAGAYSVILTGPWR